MRKEEKMLSEEIMKLKLKLKIPQQQFEQDHKLQQEQFKFEQQRWKNVIDMFKSDGNVVHIFK